MTSSSRPCPSTHLLLRRNAAVAAIFVLPVLVACVAEDPQATGRTRAGTSSCGHQGPPVLDPDRLPTCSACGDGRCVPESLLPSGLEESFPRCQESARCVPADVVASGGDFELTVCEAQGGYEGRCLSRCFAQVEGLEDVLTTAGCGNDELCVPCTDPTTGEPTGACDLGCNASDPIATHPGGQRTPGGETLSCPHEGPPVVDPDGFPTCSACGSGRCVPERLLPSELGETFPSCDEGARCVPADVIASGGSFRPSACEAQGGLEGRCLSTCFAQVQGREDVLAAGGCGQDELCVPCTDPTTGEPTGACQLGCDPSAVDGDTGPTPMPTISCPYEGAPLVDVARFPTCPGCNAGRCVPPDLVPSELAPSLADCGEGGKCVPDEILATAGNHVPADCRAFDDREGRCLSRCLPEVEAQADTLSAGSCAVHELCVPCFDPLTGEPTGACQQSCDPGPSEPYRPLACPYEGPPLVNVDALPPCPACNGGRCAPVDLIPPDLAPSLADCGEGEKCVPEDMLSPAGRFVPRSCRGVAGAEGRCLSTCLPEVEAQRDVLTRGECAASELCVPCFDLMTGEPTGACELSCDPGPAEPYQPLPRCCGEAGGTCVPPGVVPAEHREHLGRDSCPSDLVCLPDVFNDPRWRPEHCTADGWLWFDVDGACLPSCLPAVQQEDLDREDCSRGYKCVPCEDEDGDSTGACDNGFGS